MGRRRCKCCDQCKISDVAWVDSGDGTPEGWRILRGSATVQTDGTLLIAANTTLFRIEPWPSRSALEFHLPVAIGSLRFMHGIGFGGYTTDTFRGYLLDLLPDEMRMIHAHERHGDSTMSEEITRTEPITQEDGSSLILASQSGLEWKYVRPSEEKYAGGQGICATCLNGWPYAGTWDDGDQMMQIEVSSGSPLVYHYHDWPGEYWSNCRHIAGAVNSTDNPGVIPPEAYDLPEPVYEPIGVWPAFGSDYYVMLETQDTAETIGPLTLHDAHCFRFRNWGSGFDETDLSVTIEPTISFSSGGIYIPNLIPDETTFGPYGRAYYFDTDVPYTTFPGTLVNWRGNFNQLSGNWTLHPYWTEHDWPADFFYGIDPSGSYDLPTVTLSMSEFVSPSDRYFPNGNHLATWSQTNSREIGPSTPAYRVRPSLHTELTIAYVAALDVTVIRVHITAKGGATPATHPVTGEPVVITFISEIPYAWVFQSVVPGHITGDPTTLSMSLIPAAYPLFLLDGNGGAFTFGTRGLTHGGTCTISW